MHEFLAAAGAIFLSVSLAGFGFSRTRPPEERIKVMLATYYSICFLVAFAFVLLGARLLLPH